MCCSILASAPGSRGPARGGLVKVLEQAVDGLLILLIHR
jgi:hypothetical protein